MLLYIGVSEFSLSAVLIQEEERVQKPVYYISHTLQDAETRYSIAEKTAYVVIIAVRKLRYYFQSGPIIVLTDQPLKQILQRAETSGRLLAWTTELGEFEITYMPRAAIKGQALADFIVECSNSSSELTPEQPWLMKVDRSSCSTRAGVGIVLTGPDSYVCEYSLGLDSQQRIIWPSTKHWSSE